jgi:two-component system response regulator
LVIAELGPWRASVSTDVILLVDDNSDDVTLTLWAFRKSGITGEIIVASDGQEAVDLLLPTDGSVPLRPTIVLLDINMPRMSGPETLRLLRADPITKSLPVIMLTSSVDDRDIIHSYDLGANSYVQKPVGSTEFLEAAKALGVYWLGVNIQPAARVD